MSDSLRPHGLQHARLPCPSPTSGARANSYPLSQWHQSASPASHYIGKYLSFSRWVSMATHSSTFARKIPWMEGPGRLQSMGSLGVGHDSDFTFTFHFHALEKEMATYSSVLAWRIPGTGEPGGLPSMGSHRVGHDWSDLAEAAAGKNQISIFDYTMAFLHKTTFFNHIPNSPAVVELSDFLNWWFHCFNLEAMGNQISRWGDVAEKSLGWKILLSQGFYPWRK